MSERKASSLMQKIVLQQFCFGSYSVDFISEKCLLTPADKVTTWGPEKSGIQQRNLYFPLNEKLILQIQYCLIANEEEFASSFRDRDAAHLDGAQSLSINKADDKDIQSLSGSEMASLVGVLFDKLDPSVSQNSVLNSLKQLGCHFYFASGDDPAVALEHQATRICLELRLRKDFSTLAIVLRLPTPLFHELLVRSESVSYGKMISKISFLGECALWLKLESTCADFIVLDKGE